MYVHYLPNAVTRILHLIFYIDIFASRSPFYIFIFILVIIKYINILTDMSQRVNRIFIKFKYVDNQSRTTTMKFINEAKDPNNNYDNKKSINLRILNTIMR